MNASVLAVSATGNQPVTVGGDPMVSMPDILASRRQKAASVVYEEINNGLFIEPILLSARCARWLCSELEALNDARVAGLSDEERRALVAALRAKRRARAERLRLLAA